MSKQTNSKQNAYVFIFPTRNSLVEKSHCPFNVVKPRTHCLHGTFQFQKLFKIRNRFSTVGTLLTRDIDRRPVMAAFYLFAIIFLNSLYYLCALQFVALTRVQDQSSEPTRGDARCLLLRIYSYRHGVLCAVEARHANPPPVTKIPL